MRIPTTSLQSVTSHSPGSSSAATSPKIRHEYASNSLVRREDYQYECYARVKETFNKEAVYTVGSEQLVLCNDWFSNITTKCHDVETLTSLEHLKYKYTPADHRLSSVSGLFGPKGELSAIGNLNSTISECVTGEFDRIANELKQDPEYDVGRNIGFMAAGFVAGLVGLGIYIFCERRCSKWIRCCPLRFCGHRLPTIRNFRSRDIQAQSRANTQNPNGNTLNQQPFSENQSIAMSELGTNGRRSAPNSGRSSMDNRSNSTQNGMEEVD